MPVTFEGRFDGCAPSKYCLHRFPQCIGAFGAAFDGGRPSTYCIWKRLLSGRSRRRLWKVSQRQPIPTALLLITTESVPAGTARSVTEEADSRTQDRLCPQWYGPGGVSLTTVCELGRQLAPRRDFRRICRDAGVMLRSVSARCITGSETQFER